MEGSSALPSDSNNQNPTAAASDGAAKFLADLPSRGLFSSTVLSSNPEVMRIMFCDFGRSNYAWFAYMWRNWNVPKSNGRVSSVHSCTCFCIYFVLSSLWTLPSCFAKLASKSMQRVQTPLFTFARNLCRVACEFTYAIMIQHHQVINAEEAKGDSSSKDGKANAANECSRKRTSDKALGSRAKRATTSSQAASRQEGSKSRFPEKDLQSLTVERIRAILKERGLSLKGRKDELIARLKGANE